MYKYTFENTREHKSTIDYILINRNIHPTRILDVKVLSSTNTGTDHGLVLTKIKNIMYRNKRDTPEATEKLNIESLFDDTTRYFYQQS